MRNGQNKRMRSRNRKGQNPITRVFESNGPDVKIRGTAQHIADKYVQLARDAQGSGDPVAAENHYQHAEHYFRLIAAAQEQFRQTQPYFRNDGDLRDDGEGDEEQDGLYGNEPGIVSREQPYQQRDSQPYQQHREGPQHREGSHHRDGSHHRESQPYREAAPLRAPQPAVGGSDIERLPSFITGAQGAAPSQGDAAPQGEQRFPRRRRRPPHGPRSDNAAPVARDVSAPGTSAE